MNDKGNDGMDTKKTIIAGKTVTVASNARVKKSTEKAKKQYAKTLENLKNR
jgi:hypothetical protein